MLLQQPVIEVAGWVGPTIAISLVIIAAAFAVMALVVLLLGKGVATAAHKSTESLQKLYEELVPAMKSLTQRLNEDLVPAMKSMGQMAEDGRALAETIRHEVGETAGTTRRLRARIESGSERLAERLEHLEAVYDLVEEELTEAALDLTATVKTLRSGAGWFGRLRRLLGGRRRRR